MRHTLPIVLITMLAACRHEAAAADPAGLPAAVAPPQITVGPPSETALAGIGTATTWILSGTLRGELRATLRAFADGKEEKLGEASFASTEGPVVGTLLLVVRDGSSPPATEQAGARGVDIRLNLVRDPKAPPGDLVSSGANSQDAIPLPGAQPKVHGSLWGSTLSGAPGQNDVAMLWWERYGDEPRTIGDTMPWAVKQQTLQSACTGAVRALVLTLEALPDSPKTPRRVQ
jgi:hypothetical protein